MKVILIVLSLWAVSALPARPLTVAWGAGGRHTASDAQPSSLIPGSPNGLQALTRKAVISGVVVDQSGQPMANAAVYLRTSGSNAGSSKTEWTDDDGKFQFSGLFPGVFSVSARAPTHYMDLADGQTIYVRPGDSIKIRMIKGGIISGKVTGPSGDPLIAGVVKPTRVKDPEGKPAPGGQSLREFQTDDRGFYRIYGLPPGSYVVSVGGGRGYGQAKPYDLMAPTYFPSSTRDSAAEVVVSAGEESSGIDIKYREDPGYRVSGTVSGIPASSFGPGYAGTGVSLTNVKSGFVESNTYVQANDPNKAFTFYGVPDGEYDLTAVRTGGKEDGLASSPRRITVKGADVTGLQLALALLGKISGQVSLDPAPEGLKKDDRGGIDAPLAEVLITARRDGKPDPSLPSTATGTPDEKAKFALNNLASATYRIEVGLPSEDWYVREMSSSKTDKAAAVKPRGRASAPSVSDIAARGVAVKAGDHIDGISITISRGAAYVAGTVVPAMEGGTVPARTRVCLVPAEPERASDVLYYKQVAIEGGGKFVIVNIPPGKYRAVAIPAALDDSSEASFRQIAWDPAARKELRQRAESEGLELELAPRKRIKDFALKFKPPSEAAQRSLM